MASTSPGELARELLLHCIGAGQWPPALLDNLVARALAADRAAAEAATQALFSGVVEPLGDLFEPRLSDVYARLFSGVIERALGGVQAGGLVERYETVRRVRPVAGEPDEVFVLSRVTLGADVAVTSVILDAARRRFPGARIWFAGPGKNWELFERSPGLRHLRIEYGRRATLAERLACYSQLKEALDRPGSVVLDPDSRLTQLGLLPVCPAENHYLFESRAYGGTTGAPLTALAQDWAKETLGVDEAGPWLHPRYEYDFGNERVAAVSLGAGENPAKRVEDPFEEELLCLVSGRGGLVMVDAGAPGSEEEARVKRAAEGALRRGARIGIHEGAFASFAALIAASAFYAGYDSAGQHVAAALGVPLVCVFNGYASLRTAQRWAPGSSGPCTVILAKEKRPEEVLEELRSALC